MHNNNHLIIIISHTQCRSHFATCSNIHKTRTCKKTETRRSRSRSFKVTENDTTRKLECGFLFAFDSNYGPILYPGIIAYSLRFRDTQTNPHTDGQTTQHDAV